MDKKFYQDLLDKMSDGVYFVTVDRNITYWNSGAERITGYGADEVLGHSCGEGLLRHVTGAGRQLCLHGCPLLAVMEDGKPRKAQVYLHHKDGHRVPVTVRGQALRFPDGQIVGSVEVFHIRGANPYASQRRDRRDDSLDTVTSRCVGAVRSSWPCCPELTRPVCAPPPSGFACWWRTPGSRGVRSRCG